MLPQPVCSLRVFSPTVVSTERQPGAEANQLLVAPSSAWGKEAMCSHWERRAAHLGLAGSLARGSCGRAEGTGPPGWV